MKRSLFLACVVLVGLSAFARAEEGNPKITKIETIAFGPNGLLVIGGNSQVVTVDTGDTKETKNVPENSAAKNGPGTISDALTEFEAQAAKLPTGPTPDPNVAVA